MIKTLQINDSIVSEILGRQDEYLKHIKSSMGININIRGSTLTMEGDEAQVLNGNKLFENLIEIASRRDLTFNDIETAIKMISNNTKTAISSILTNKIKVSGFIKEVIPKSEKQNEYINAIRKSDISFGIGPAGTGKTYLAMAMAINYYLNKDVSRIILARPAVEAGENLGFLPGDIAEKITPYLKPLYDALYSMLDIDRTNKLIEKGVIELAPLAFMRGRTLNDSFIILDEAQNSTLEQMKMFLTRIGFNSKAVVTGDITQIDLPPGKQSGLVIVKDILKNIEAIRFITFDEKDVVRHPLIQKIIKAYELFENAQKN